MSAIFFHIPKTAGTTLTELILKNHRKDIYFHLRGSEDQSPEEIRNKAASHDFVWGHFRFRPELAEDNFFLLSFLRQPVDRCLSQFFHYRRDGEFGEGPLLEQMEFFLSGEQVKEYGTFNLQTRFMAGMLRQRDLHERPDEHLKVAVAHLEKLDFVGIAENFRESAFMLGQKLGWKKWYYLPQNVHSRPEEKKLILESFGPELRRINEMDTELYRRGLELFEKQRNSISIPKLKRFRAVSLSRLKKLMKG